MKAVLATLSSHHGSAVPRALAQALARAASAGQPAAAPGGGPQPARPPGHWPEDAPALAEPPAEEDEPADSLLDALAADLDEQERASSDQDLVEEPLAVPGELLGHWEAGTLVMRDLGQSPPGEVDSPRFATSAYAFSGWAGPVPSFASFLTRGYTDWERLRPVVQLHGPALRIVPLLDVRQLLRANRVPYDPAPLYMLLGDVGQYAEEAVGQTAAIRASFGRAFTVCSFGRSLMRGVVPPGLPGTFVDLPLGYFVDPSLGPGSEGRRVRARVAASATERS